MSNETGRKGLALAAIDRAIEEAKRQDASLRVVAGLLGDAREATAMIQELSRPRRAKPEQEPTA